jgi:4-hydroxybenzoyl-CoA reductase subunit beta
MKREGSICLVAPGSPRCWAISSADTVPVLVALRARVRLVSVRGEREIPIQELFRDDGLRPYNREADEVLSEVRLPPALGWRSTYLKLRRRGSFDFPILGVAVALRCEQDGRIGEARIALGAVASHPVEAEEAMARLQGQQPTPALLQEVATLAAKRARPLDNADLTITYRKQLTPVYVRRALALLLGTEPGSQGGGAE